MKNISKLMTILLIVCLSFTFGCSKEVSPKTQKTIKALKYQDIKAVYSIPAGMHGFEERHIFNLEKEETSKTVKSIVSSLNSGEIQGKGEGSFRKGGGHYTIVLELINGDALELRAAVKAESIKTSDGISGKQEVNIPDEVIIEASYNEEPIRILEPDLRKIIDSGI
jgi:hypothetical protein